MTKFKFSPMFGWKNPNFKSEKNSKKKTSFCRVNVFKIVCLFVPVHISTDSLHIGRATTILSLYYQGPRVLCPLTIGISAVVCFFALTGNSPCKYNNLKLVLRMHKKINTN